MNFMRIRIFPLLFVIAAFVVPGYAGAATAVKASLDSVNLRMGDMTTLHLSVSMQKGTKGDFPLLKHFRDDGIIPVCGDSVELRAPSKVDTVENGDLLSINYDIPLQAFDSGYYRLPEFVFVTGKDSVRSNALALKVYPVNANADTPIHDYASVADPAGSSIFDFLPDWLIDLWWLWILILLAAAVSVYALRRYRKNGFILPKKPEPTPYEAASSALRSLKEKQLWEKGMEKEYFTELTEILRTYLYRRFGINAMEMTSRQILASLKSNPELSDKRRYFRQILDMADFVKFAKVRPLPDDNVLAFDNAVRFVEETKPVPVEPDADKTVGDSGKPAAKKTANKKGGKK